MKIKQFILNVICLLLVIYFDGEYNLKGILIMCSFILNAYYIKIKYSQKKSLTELSISKKIILAFSGIVITASFLLLYASLIFIIFKDYTLEIKEFSLFEIIKALLLFPLLEEFVFRKYLLTTLLFKYSTKTAIVVSSLGFAFCHIFTDTGLLQAFLCGCFFSWVYIKSNNIILCIILHSFINFTSIYFNQEIKNQITRDPILTFIFSFAFIIIIIIALNKKLNAETLKLQDK